VVPFERTVTTAETIQTIRTKDVNGSHRSETLMIEPTQILVQKYLEMQGYFLKSNVRYAVPRNYSDIDLMGINKEGEGIVAEVKAWGTMDVGLKDGMQLVDDFSFKPFSNKVREILGEKRKIRKILVLASIGSRSIQQLEDYARTTNVEIITLDSVIKSLLENLEPNLNYDNEALQIIRLLRLYKQCGKVSFTFS
jgi:hypothetical protein